MIPKTLTFDLEVEGQDSTKNNEVEIKLPENSVNIYDGESTALLSLEQLDKLGEIWQQVGLMRQKAFIAKQALPPPAGVAGKQIIDKLPPEAPANAFDALRARDSFVSNLYVVGTDGAYYPNNITPGQAVEFVSRVAQAKMFESPSDAYEIAGKFPGCNAYKFSDIGNYRIIIPQADGSLAYYNGTGKVSTHVNDSLQFTGREASLRIAEQHQGAFLLPVTE